MEQSISSLPVVDLDVFLTDPNSPEAKQQAQNAADALIWYGALVVKDSRVTEVDNEQFLDLMEDYFAQQQEELKLVSSVLYPLDDFTCKEVTWNPHSQTRRAERVWLPSGCDSREHGEAKMCLR